ANRVAMVTLSRGDPLAHIGRRTDNRPMQGPCTGGFPEPQRHYRNTLTSEALRPRDDARYRARGSHPPSLILRNLIRISGQSPRNRTYQSVAGGYSALPR